MPIPEVASFAELSVQLLECYRRRWDERLHGHADTIGERLMRDRGAFLPLPPAPYDACESNATSSNAGGEGRGNKNRARVRIRMTLGHRIGYRLDDRSESKGERSA